MRSTRSGTVALCAQLVICGAASTAGAQEQVHDRALAHDLFDEGRTLMAAKQYDRACEKFEQSRKVDPGDAGGTLLNLALCRESSGRTATAWALYREARGIAIRARRDDRREFAEQHIAALTPRLCRLRITVPAVARLPGLVVKRNNVALAESEWGEALIADPGPQRVDVTAPGKLPLHLAVTVSGDGSTEEVTIPALKDDGANLRAAEPRPRGPSFFAGPQRVAAVAVGAAGVLTAGIGGLYGVLAVRKQHAADTLCPNYDHCDPYGLAVSADANAAARLETALVVGGAVGLGIGVVLFLTAPRVEHRDAHGVAVAPSGQSFVTRVRF